MGRLLLVWRLAVKDIRHRPALTILMLLVIAAGVATLTLGLALRGTTDNPYARTRAATSGPDVVATDINGDPQAPAQPGDLAPLEHAPGVVAYSGPFPITWASLHSGHTTATAEVEGRSSAPSAVDRPKLTQGGWVRPGGVVVEATFAQALGLHVGDRVRLGDSSFEVVGTAATAAFPTYPVASALGELPGGKLRYQQHRSRLGARGRCSAHRGGGRGARLLPHGPEARGPRRRPGVRGPLRLIAAREQHQRSGPERGGRHLARHPHPELLAEHPGQGHPGDRQGAAGPRHGELAARASGARERRGARRRPHGRTARAAWDCSRRSGGRPGSSPSSFCSSTRSSACCAAGLGLLAGWLAAPLVDEPGAGLLGAPSAPSLTVSTVGLAVALALGVALVATFVPAVRAARQSTVAALEDAARVPRRRARLIALSAHLPVPLLLGVRLAVRRPARLLLSVFSVAVTTSGLVVVLILHQTVGGVLGPVVSQATTTISLMLVLLAATNAIFIAWTTALETRRPAAVARALGATPRQVAIGLSVALLLPALLGALLGVVGGIGLHHAAKEAGPTPVPPVLWLVALVLLTLLVFAVLTAVPVSIDARRPVAEVLQSEAD